MGSVFLSKVHPNWPDLKSAGDVKTGTETTIHADLRNPNVCNFCFLLRKAASCAKKYRTNGKGVWRGGYFRRMVRNELPFMAVLEVGIF